MPDTCHNRRVDTCVAVICITQACVRGQRYLYKLQTSQILHDWLRASIWLLLQPVAIKQMLASKLCRHDRGAMNAYDVRLLTQ